MKPIRIALYGNFGAGNLGNECSLQTAIEQILRRWPDAQMLCLCTEPRDVEARHHVAAFCSSAQDLGWSWAAPDSSAESLSPKVVGGRGLIGSVARLGRIVFRRIPLELMHWVRSLWILTRTDLLIVPGTGIVTDSCGPRGWPYELFKFSALGALCGVDIVFLSVGVGPIRHPLSRWFIMRSLAFARYRSYRDEDSRQYLKRIGFDVSADSVCPDLVFGLSAHVVNTQRELPRPRTRIIGVGLKDYSMPKEGTDADGYRSYLDLMATFVFWLLDHGYIVRLLIGDAQYDTPVRQDLLGLLTRAGVPADGLRVVSQPVTTVNELLRQIDETDAVISPRYHNLVLGLMLNKPVLALSCLAKVDALLNEIGLPQYRIALDGAEPDTLTSRFTQLQSEAERLESYISQRVARYRDAVNAQYEALFPQAGAVSAELAHR
jgi:polysaccharide pyruvyl transferase WcaK-like protein